MAYIGISLNRLGGFLGHITIFLRNFRAIILTSEDPGSGFDFEQPSEDDTRRLLSRATEFLDI